MKNSRKNKSGQADCAVDSFVCSHSRRSGRLKLSSNNSTQITKLKKKTFEEPSGILVCDEAWPITTVDTPERFVKDREKPKRKKSAVRYGLKRKRAKIEIKSQRAIPPGLENGNFENANGKMRDAEVNAELLVEDHKDVDQTGEQFEPLSFRKLQGGKPIQQDAGMLIQSTQMYESPRKRRMKNQNRSQDCPVGSSPKKCARENFNPLDTKHIQIVKSALHLATLPDDMLCRDEEQSKVFQFCKGHLLQKQAGSLYVCGCPGTGKSLLIEKAKLLASRWAKEGALPEPEILNFNCTSLTKPSDIFQRILSHISSQGQKKNAESYKMPVLKKVKNALRIPAKKSTWRMVMLIIDEMDYLISKDQSVLCELFGLSAQADSRCILIGIANAIDLTDRFLPKLNSRCCHPTVISFPAYTKEQVTTVLNQRIKVLPFAVFQSAALELCARKIAAASGDMRKALHVCRIAVELLESELRIGLDGSEARKQGNQHSKSEVQIYHMAQALTKTFRSAVVDAVKLLPKHQQMVLCAAVRLFRQGKKDATLGQLNAAYLEFCKSTDIPALSVPEFSSLCSVLADQGLLNIGSSREDRLRRVMLHVNEDEIVYALQTIRFFRNCLN